MVTSYWWTVSGHWIGGSTLSCNVLLSWIVSTVCSCAVFSIFCWIFDVSLVGLISFFTLSADVLHSIVGICSTVLVGIDSK